MKPVKKLSPPSNVAKDGRIKESALDTESITFAEPKARLAEIELAVADNLRVSSDS